MAHLNIIGGGLAGCEAAKRLAAHGLTATLWEMKPHKFSPAHKEETLAELVCSNSLRSSAKTSAVGLLKEELLALGSIVMEAALATKVPAGKALAVDRLLFSQKITAEVENLPGITVKRMEITSWPTGDGPIILASGPLSSDSLVDLLAQEIGSPHLSFYDALAPIVTYDSLDLNKIFKADRYGEDDGDYLNCPFEKDEFMAFLEALTQADQVGARPFEHFPEEGPKETPAINAPVSGKAPQFFEGCLPIEVMASRGPRTLTFGPMKPVGLTDPKTGRRPYAVVQLRRENQAGTLWNLVGFQTRLRRPEQDKVFRLIPGLEKANFARYGAIHRNTYLEAPKVLDDFCRLKTNPRIFTAGQISGVEGYVESAAHGLWAGENAARQAKGLELLNPPPTTALGALLSHLKDYGGRKYFAPSNVNFGLFPPPPAEVPKNQRSEYLLNQAEKSFQDFLASIDFPKL